MSQLIVVGISDQNTAFPPDTLITYALGSCVGICIFDPVTRYAGMSHILLPSSSLTTNDKNIYKFADTAIKALVSVMERKGCNRARMTAKIAGGANMFLSSGQSIGDRNVQAVKEELSKLRIRIIAEDVGGNYGRTIQLDPQDGSVMVKTTCKGNSVM